MDAAVGLCCEGDGTRRGQRAAPGVCATRAHSRHGALTVTCTALQQAQNMMHDRLAGMLQQMLRQCPKQLVQIHPVELVGGVQEVKQLAEGWTQGSNQGQ